MERGRPRKITAEIIKAIADDVSRPIPFKYACEANGIKEGTGYDWMRRGEAGEEPFDVFFEAVTRARANAVRKLVEHSLNGGRGSQNAVWHLERRYRDDYGDVKRIEHAGHDGGAVQINVKPIHEMTDDELTAALQRFAAPGGTLPAGTPEAPRANVNGSVLPADGPGVFIGSTYEDGDSVPGGPGARGHSTPSDLHAAASLEELSREREIPGVVPGQEPQE